MYTVTELVKLSSVSPRTLHYYDEIHLLKPAAVNEVNFRLHNQENVTRLQQILFFKTFHFKLDEIKEILEKEPAFVQKN